MLRSRILTSKAIAAWVALVIALAIPVSVLAQGMTLTLTAQAGTFTGKWVYRSFSISANPKDTLAKLALGLNELNLTEQGGRIVGQRTGTGVSYDLKAMRSTSQSKARRSGCTARRRSAASSTITTISAI